MGSYPRVYSTKYPVKEIGVIRVSTFNYMVNSALNILYLYGELSASYRII